MRGSPYFFASDFSSMLASGVEDSPSTSRGWLARSMGTGRSPIRCGSSAVGLPPKPEPMMATSARRSFMAAFLRARAGDRWKNLLRQVHLPQTVAAGRAAAGTVLKPLDVPEIDQHAAAI